MEQTKIFCGCSGIVEKEINAWLKKMNNKVTIIDRKFSFSIAPSENMPGPQQSCAVAIFYRKK
jgi:hypothetical protein